MLTVGVDAHKQVNSAVALDERGRALGQWHGPNAPHGWQELARWAAGWDMPCQWGIEGAWNYGRGLAQHLVADGTRVYEVNPRWTAQERRAARPQAKNDRLDAQAVARLVWREGTALPQVQGDDEASALDLLVTEREGALAEATRLRNQLHALLMQLDPLYRTHVPCLQTQAGLRCVLAYMTTSTVLLQQSRAASVRRTAERLQLAERHATELAAEIAAHAQQRYAPLTRLCGINLLTAGTLAGILGPGHRFASEAQLAAYAGVAPVEASSAGQVRHRLNRGGNRHLNAILYRIALTQARHSPQARAYLARRTAEGKTKREALRALKRYLIRAIWRLWQECLAVDTRLGPSAAA